MDVTGWAAPYTYTYTYAYTYTYTQVDVTGWAAPDGTPLASSEVVTLVRGLPGAALRYTVRAP